MKLDLVQFCMNAPTFPQAEIFVSERNNLGLIKILP